MAALIFCYIHIWPPHFWCSPLLSPPLLDNAVLQLMNGVLYAISATVATPRGPFSCNTWLHMRPILRYIAISAPSSASEAATSRSISAVMSMDSHSNARWVARNCAVCCRLLSNYGKGVELTLPEVSSFVRSHDMPNDWIILPLSGWHR